MSQKPATGPYADLGRLIGAIAGDAETLVAQHVALLRSEIGEEVGDLGRAVALCGAGAGLVAAGGVLGSLMLVHGLHRATRLPLWGCYGIVGGVAAGLGASLAIGGVSRAGRLSLVPRQTIAALREDIAWIKDQTNREAS